MCKDQKRSGVVHKGHVFVEEMTFHFILFLTPNSNLMQDPRKIVLYVYCAPTLHYCDIMIRLFFQTSAERDIFMTYHIRRKNESIDLSSWGNLISNHSDPCKNTVCIISFLPCLNVVKSQVQINKCRNAGLLRLMVFEDKRKVH